MIQVESEGPVAIIALARPDARNALSVAGWQALADAAGEIAAGPARAVLLRSDMPAIFSAGADIGEFEAFRTDPDAAARFRTTMRGAIEAVASLPMPSIAIVDGGCFGAAVALALACDLRVAGEGAQFAVTPAKLGIGYPRQDVERLVRQVGRGQAARFLFTGEIVDGAEAHRIGLAELRWEEAEPLARAFAERIAANASEAVRLLKRTLDEPGSIELDHEFDARFAGTEFAEGLAAFRERRRPVYP